jgi:hypothetical protein
MANKTQNPLRSRSIGDFEQASAIRREADLALPMSERLTRLHTLCKQMNAIKGATAR